jgi:hypothetical protein
MLRLRWRFVCCVVLTVSAVPFGSALAAEGEFPFDRELMLDVAPMRGSKRIPIVEIAENGSASIQLWCTSVRGRANVAADALTIVAGDAPPGQCAPERQNGDVNLLAALAQVTGWRRRGDVIEFLGATTLRFRLMTN